ncbi:MAG: hypothetical protein V3R99_04065 [Thermoguttaceae bacterium]
MMHRRAMTLLETIVAAAMLTGIMTVCLQMLSVVAAQHRVTEARQMAIREAANTMERLSAMPWDELATETLQSEKLSELATQRLTGAELTIDITESSDPLDAKRIALSIRWKDRAGQFVRPVKLTAWRVR